MVSLALLGPVHVALNGRPIHFRTSKVQALLIYLAVEACIRPAPRHRREALMELLWPGLPLASAQDNLRQTVYQLRKALPGVPLLEADRQYLSLHQHCAITLDLATFRDLVRGAPAPEQLEQAAALFRGDFLADFYLADSEPFEAWAANQRALVRGQALEALDQLAACLIAQGALAKAEQAVRRQLELDELREQAHRRLMLVLAQANRRNQAVRHYEALTILLKRELGVEPDAETTALYDAIVAGQLPAPATQPAALETARQAAAALPEERRWVTVVCAEVANFAALTQHLDPEDMKASAEAWVERMNREIERFGGMLLSSVGVEIVAVFGAPLSHEDDAERAVRAALALAGLAGDGMREARLRAMITTGNVLAGPSGQHRYVVIGDAVNVAAQLLPVVPPGAVWVAETTCTATSDSVSYRPVRPALPAHQPPIAVWQALSAGAPALARPFGTVPLIGRDQELQRMLAMWRRVVEARQPHLLTILGEAGIGKSRLVAEFERSLSPTTVVLQGSCLPYGSAHSYGALEAFVRQAAGITADDDAAAARAKLEARVAQVCGPVARREEYAELARHLALMTSLDLAPDRLAGGRDERAFRVSAHRFLVALAHHEPLCLIVDNLQWADVALLDLIEYVATHAHDVPLLLVTQSRPEFVEQHMGWAGRVPSFTVLRLQPLDAPAEQALLQALCLERRVPQHTADHLRRSTGGNPLYAEELVAMVAEQGHTAGIPFAIKRLISARIDTLPAGERQVVQVAAVLGTTFWESAVRLLAGRDVAAPLEALAQKGILRLAAYSRYPGEYEYSFKHDLIRDVAYEILPRAERRGLHGRAADWFETLASTRVEARYDVIVHHALHAEQHERALTALMRAAEQAERATARRQEVMLLAEAITLAERLQPDLVPELRARRGRAFVDMSMWGDAARELSMAMAHGRSFDAEQRVQMLADLAWARFWLVEVEGQHEAAEDALAIAAQAGRDDLRVKALFAVGFSQLNHAHLDTTQELCEQALGYAPGQPIRERAMASWASGLVSFWQGRFEQAIASYRRAVELGQEQRDTVPTLTAMPQLGLALAGSGRYAEAEQVYTQVQQLAREYENWPFLARAISMSAGFHLDLFDYDAHEGIARQACEIAQSAGFVPPVISSQIDLLLNWARRHEVAQCEMLLPEVAQLVEPLAGFHGWLWRLRLSQARAEIALAKGDWQAAVGYAEQGIARSRAFGRVKYQALSLETRAKALVALGRTKHAIADLQQATALLRSIGDPAVFVRVSASLLAIAGDDTLLAETHATLQRLRAALPSSAMQAAFEVADPVRLVGRLIGA